MGKHETDDLGTRIIACGSRFQWMDGMAWHESANREGWHGRWHSVRGFIDSDGYSADMDPERPVPTVADPPTQGAILHLANAAWRRQGVHRGKQIREVAIERVPGGWRWRLSTMSTPTFGTYESVTTIGLGNTVAEYAEACVCSLERSPGQ